MFLYLYSKYPIFVEDNLQTKKAFSKKRAAEKKADSKKNATRVGVSEKKVHVKKFAEEAKRIAEVWGA